MMADQQREMQSMSKGNIAVAVGMKNVSQLQGYSILYYQKLLEVDK